MRSRAVFADRVIPGDLALRGHRTPIAPQLRGRVPLRLIEYWRRAGWRIHRVGRAAYVHSPDDRHHFLVGAWSRRAAQSPPWAARLGQVSQGYLRRSARLAREQRGRRFIRAETGQFLAPLPRWRVPGPRLYSWLEPTPSLFERERGSR